MPNEIRTKIVATKQPLTITLAALAHNAGRQSTMVPNPNGYPAALVYLKIKSGAVAPTAGAIYEVYLLRSDDVGGASAYRTDGAAAADAAFAVENATLLGTVVVTATAGKIFYGDFDTSAWGPLGPEWGIAVRNLSGQALGAVEGEHVKEYSYYVPEAQ
jgi:hypothetical protein